jgi:hypothetical protein
MWSRRAVGWLAAVLVVALAAAAQAYDVGPVTSTDATAVPDVNKNPWPPANNDMGCWAAAASNVLGAAGWGKGASAQAKADNIYQDLINQFKVNGVDTYLQCTGCAGPAAKWWVHNIGLDQADAGNGYTPDATYVNFREVNRTLNESDYNFLLRELNRGQYAAVRWVIPGADVGHCITLVGGNYGPNMAPQNGPPWTSVWHDSDTNNVAPGDEARNTWNFVFNQDNVWRLDVNNTRDVVNDDWIAEGYFLACPGVPKPSSAIGNFDVHRYIGLTTPLPADQNNPTWHCDPEVQMMTTGSSRGVYADPAGNVDAYWDFNDPLSLIIPNQQDDTRQKKLYILVDFNDPALVRLDNFGKPIAPDIKVYDDHGNQINVDSASWASDNGEVMMTYTFDTQPPWEKVTFPGAEYKDLMALVGDNVYEWNIATECVPEPATLSLLGLGLAAALARRRARRG